jgi:hypothetical protein
MLLLVVEVSHVCAHWAAESCAVPLWVAHLYWHLLHLINKRPAAAAAEAAVQIVTSIMSSLVSCLYFWVSHLCWHLLHLINQRPAAAAAAAAAARSHSLTSCSQPQPQHHCPTACTSRSTAQCSCNMLQHCCCWPAHLNCTLLGGTRTHHTDAQLLKKPSSYGLGTWLWLYLQQRQQHVSGLTSACAQLL